MGKLPVLGAQSREGVKSVAASPGNKIITASIQPPLFSFHLSFNQHSPLKTCSGLALFITTIGWEVEVLSSLERVLASLKDRNSSSASVFFESQVPLSSYLD